MHSTRAVLCISAALFLLCSISAAEPPSWESGVLYKPGALVTYNGLKYKSVYAHTSIAGWEPTAVKALWAPAGFEPVSKPQSRRPRLIGAQRRMFAPYIHLTETTQSLRDVRKASGVKWLTLAFIVADGGCAPAWQGKPAQPVVNDTKVLSDIKAVRASGGDVIISFGGAVGQEMAQACPQAASLQRAYQSVIDKYRVKILDFDVEAAAVSDPASIDRRNQALKALAAANSGLQISFTLPVFPNGLPGPAMNVLRSAVDSGVPVSLVNLMTMDYGYAMPEGNMAAAAMAAVDSTSAQLESLGLSAAMGITPMIGSNDTPGETFTPIDARAVLAYARSRRDIMRLSFWSMGRDNGGCAGSVSPNCSGIVQKDWAFSRVFAGY